MYLVVVCSCSSSNNLIQFEVESLGDPVLVSSVGVNFCVTDGPGICSHYVRWY